MAVPSGAPPGSVGAQPLAIGLATTDYFLGWQPGVFPASSVLVQNSQFIGLDHSTSLVAASGSATSGTLSFWTGMLVGTVSGAVMSSGTISNTAIVATSLTVTGALVANGAVSGSGITALFASPPPLGSTTANTVAATTLTASGATILGNGSANYLVINGASTGSGVTITATGSDANINVHAVVKGTGVFEALRGSLGTSNGSAALFDGSTALSVIANPTYTGTGGQSFLININAAGTISSGSPFLNVLEIADSVNATGVGGASAFYVDHVLNAGWEGPRTAWNIGLSVAGAPGASLGSGFLTALGINAQTNQNLGGTSIAAAGYFTGQSIQTTLNSGATYYSLAEAIEMGLTINTGASALFANVFKISAGSPVVASNSYNGIAIGNGGPGPGFSIGICFAPGETTTNPIATTGTLIGSQTANGATLQAAYGIDLSLWTFSTAFLKYSGFAVTNTGTAYGNLTSATITSTVGVTLTAAQVVGAVIFRTNAPTGAFTDTTDTATNIIAAIPGATVNTSWKLRYVNRDNNVCTLVGGTGVTVIGTNTITNNTWRDFLCHITNIGTPAVTMTSMGAGTAS